MINLAYYLELVIIFLMIVASYIDIKKKEIEDHYSYAIAIISFILIILTKSNLILGVIYGLILFGLGYILYVNGMWGGGDTKLLGALGIYFSIYGVLAVLVYFMSLALIGILYNNIIALFYLPQLVKSKNIDKRIAWIFFVMFLLTLYYQYFIFSLFVILFFDIYYFNKFEKNIMSIKKRVNDLTEGDWLIEDIKGIPKRNIGLVEEDIVKLKKMNVKEVKIKDGFAFIPVMAMALITLFLVIEYGYLNIETLVNIIQSIVT